MLFGQPKSFISVGSFEDFKNIVQLIDDAFANLFQIIHHQNLFPFYQVQFPLIKQQSQIAIGYASVMLLMLDVLQLIGNSL